MTTLLATLGWQDAQLDLYALDGRGNRYELVDRTRGGSAVAFRGEITDSGGLEGAWYPTLAWVDHRPWYDALKSGMAGAARQYRAALPPLDPNATAVRTLTTAATRLRAESRDRLSVPQRATLADLEAAILCLVCMVEGTGYKRLQEPTADSVIEALSAASLNMVLSPELRAVLEQLAVATVPRSAFAPRLE